MAKENYNKKVFDVLKDLHKQFPNWDICRHLDGALADYDGHIWSISDKELYGALMKYQAELEYNDLEDLSRIIQDGINLDSMIASDDDC